MRRTSPCTRIIGGRPEDRCRSDALFLTTKASSSVRSITILPARNFAAVSEDYGCNCRQPASCEEAHRGRGARGRPQSIGGGIVWRFEDACCRARSGGWCGRGGRGWRGICGRGVVGKRSPFLHKKTPK